MAQNITLLGANYPDVPAVTLPITGGGTAIFSDTRSVTYNLSGGATASVTPSEVVAGQGFSVKLNAPTGYNLNNVTVTMGGVDITSQVFTPDESGGSPSATQHTIYFEFSDSTNTTINAWYDDAFISNAITATNQPVYGSKTVTLAQLDGVTWYDASDIPMNTELIDFTKSSSNTMINERGQAVAEDWYYASDYTTVAAGMTFSYTASRWGYIGLYDENKTVVRVIDCSSDGTVDQSDSNLVHGTISGSQLTNVAYARLSGAGNNSYSMSLIRTA